MMVVTSRRPLYPVLFDEKTVMPEISPIVDQPYDVIAFI
jgi:hypothetical protein